MKKCFLFFTLIPVLLFAQEHTNTITFGGRIIPSITLTAGGSKTIWFAFPPSYGVPANPEADTSAAVNPPDRVLWSGSGDVYMRKLSGAASDSARLLAQGIDAAGNLIDNNDQYLAGGASTFSSVFSNGNVKTFSITGLFGTVYGLKLTFTHGDLTHGAVYEVKLSLHGVE